MQITNDKAFCEAVVDRGLLTARQVMELLFEGRGAEAGWFRERCVGSGLLTPAEAAEIQRMLDFDEPSSPAHVGMDPGPEPVRPFSGGWESDQTFGDSDETLQWPEENAPDWQTDERDGERLDLAEQVGRYLEQQEIGRGGMGVVYRVSDAVMGRKVALKELLPDLVLDPAFSDFLPELRQRFIREAELTSTLQHPGIVPVYELGQRLVSGEAYYTMKLVEGRTMADLIATADGLEARLELLPNFIDVCQTIAYAHSRCVIHRDLKPMNIIVGEYGETYVLDWGIAKRLSSQRGQDGAAPACQAESTNSLLTANGSPVGTPFYMSPEQALGCVEDIDERSDIYSLGAILYEILLGRKPRSIQDAQALSTDFGQLRSVADSVEFDLSLPRELIAICQRAMAIDKQDRFANALDLAYAIQHLQTGAEVVLERLAEAVHDAYVRERRAQGWSYGPVRDDARKENPTLIPYLDLSEDEKDLDRVTVRQTIEALRELGFIVARERKPFPV